MQRLVWSRVAPQGHGAPEHRQLFSEVRLVDHLCCPAESVMLSSPLLQAPSLLSQQSLGYAAQQWNKVWAVHAGAVRMSRLVAECKRDRRLLTLPSSL